MSIDAALALGFTLGVLATICVMSPVALVSLWVVNRNGKRLADAITKGGIHVSLDEPQV